MTIPTRGTPPPTNPKIALLGGEGIGPEVVEATAKAVQALVPSVEFLRPPHGDETVASEGTAIPEATKNICREVDGILFGAVWKCCGDVLRYLRWGLDTYANVRPAKSRPGISGPLENKDKVDMVLVRENTEGEYPTREGKLEDFKSRWPDFTDIIGQTMPDNGVFALRITTEKGSRRIAEFACQTALRRRSLGFPGKVSIITKQNVLKQSDGIFKEIAEETCKKHDLESEHFYIDDACRRLVAHPQTFDVVLSPNMFGDIMSDVASELVGGLGMTGSGVIGENAAYFESVHGSAPDIMGKGIANPIATMLSAQMMLTHLGFEDEAGRLENAINSTLEEKKTLTPDLGGSATTDQVTQAIIAKL